jgi:hypothetical protein
MPPQPPVFEERQPLIGSSGRYWLLLIAVPALLAMYALRVAEWPVFVGMLYIVYVAVFGTRRVRLDPHGFQLTTSPWLTGVRDWRGGVADVRCIMRHHRRVIEHRHSAAVDYYYVAAELHSGALVLLRGPWGEPEPADEAVAFLSALWPAVPAGAPRHGEREHGTQRRATVRATLFWTFGLIAALALTAFGSTLRRPARRPTQNVIVSAHHTPASSFIIVIVPRLSVGSMRPGASASMIALPNFSVTRR